MLWTSQTEEKSNEITAIPELLELLELKGHIVTIDEMGKEEKEPSAMAKGMSWMKTNMKM